MVVAPSGVGSGVGTLDDSWQPDVEIWDVRREYLPKQTFWLGGSPVCRLFRSQSSSRITSDSWFIVVYRIEAVLSPSSNPDVLWCLNRKTSAFQQVDIQQEAISPIDYVPKVTAAWSADGSLAFAIGSNRCSSEDSAHVYVDVSGVSRMQHTSDAPSFVCSQLAQSSRSCSCGCTDYRSRSRLGSDI